MLFIYCFLLQSCEELVLCLSVGDFADFTAQLEGLASIYQLNAEKKVKCKAFSALQSLEADLGTLATLQSFIKEPFNLVHKSPVGILEKRRGGMFFNKETQSFDLTLLKLLHSRLYLDTHILLEWRPVVAACQLRS